jgi:hypothetical protein
MQLDTFVEQSANLLGATKKIKTSEQMITTLPKTRKPGARNSFWNSLMVVTLCSAGPFNAMMVAPTMQRKQPTLPKSVRRSFRKMEDRMALP